MIQPKNYPDLTFSVFLRSVFLSGGDSDDTDDGGDGLFEWIEEQIRSQYPGASVSIRAADLLDGDWEVQIGELGSDRLSPAARGDIQSHLHALLRESIARFPRQNPL